MAQEAPAAQSGMYQSDANKRIHFLHPVLNKALESAGELPVRDSESFDWSRRWKEENFLHDGTERPIVRYEDKDGQKMYFSGKKKQHAVKNILLISVLCKVVFPSSTCGGKTWQKSGGWGRLSETDARREQTSSGYRFSGIWCRRVIIIQPKKKPRGGELNEEEKGKNREIPKIRIRIGHAVSGVKRYRTAKDKIRNWKKGFRDMVMETCCGLHNFRLRFRPWTPVAVSNLTYILWYKKTDSPEWIPLNSPVFWNLYLIKYMEPYL